MNTWKVLLSVKHLLCVDGEVAAEAGAVGVGRTTCTAVRAGQMQQA